MPIENRDLPVGTRLVAKYKTQNYLCLVEAAEGGEGVVYALQGGKRHKSPSSAGMEVMGGKAVNGWRFWSVEGKTHPAGETPAPAATETPAKTRKARKTIYKLPNQQGVAQGKTKWFCTACMKSFVADGAAEPQVCPEGHAIDDAELLAPPSADAVAADQAEVAE